MKIRHSEQVEMAAYTERVGVLTANFPSTILVNLAVAVVYAVLMWDYQPHWHLQVWLGLLLYSIILRTVISLRCRSQLRQDNARIWVGRFTLGALIAGLIWGAAGVVFPLHGAQEQAVFLLGGLAAGSVVMNAAILPVYFAFVLPMLTPLTLFFFCRGWPARDSQRQPGHVLHGRDFIRRLALQPSPVSYPAACGGTKAHVR